MQRCWFWLGLVIIAGQVSAQETVVVRPRETDDVLINPGIGFTTFQRFNGDRLNSGTRWTEGYPIDYQLPRETLPSQDYPMTTIAYLRIYWKFMEPEKGTYRWDLIDRALRTARKRGQTLMLRIAPYGTDEGNDVPAWYRDAVSEQAARKLPVEKWRVDPESALYVEQFGGFIRALGKRYDAHPDLELVDVSLVGTYGEGAGTDLLTERTRNALLDAYLDSFPKTPLVLQLKDPKGTQYALSKRPVGWRVDCFGDMGGFSKTWSHMEDYYPQTLIQVGMQEAWKTAPVTMEACWVMQHWKDQGWDISHIIDESLKWHISSFNAKSSAVPKEWWPQVNQWLKRMGYRYVLRKFTYPVSVRSRGKLAFTSWWENKGVAPCYRRFPLALRLQNAQRIQILVTDADIRSWLPGDVVYDDAVFLPEEMPEGEYDLALALVDPVNRDPKVKLAIAGSNAGGWYPLGRIRVGQEAEAHDRK